MPNVFDQFDDNVFDQFDAEPSMKIDQAERQKNMQELASEIGAGEAALIGMGRGFMNVGRGLGLADKEEPVAKQAMEALKAERPYTTGAGELVGEALPFIVPGAGIGNIASMPARVAAGGVLGATEGGILASGQDKDVVQGAGMGLSIGAASEALFPVVGRLARKVFNKVRGVEPAGALLDSAGNPMPELKSALDDAGMSFDDLTQDATDFIKMQKQGAAPSQVATAAQFAEEGVPVSTGDVTQAFEKQAIEQRLMQSSSDQLADQFRQFKLTQSEAIKDRLTQLSPDNPIPEETGNMIKDALTGRKKLLRTQKNALYSQASDAAENVGGIPMFVDNIKDAVVDADTLEDLAITAPQSAESLAGILKRYGIVEPSAQEIEAGFKTVQLDLKNFERFRKTLNAIERGDTTGAISVAINPIKDALDDEAMNLADILKSKGYADDVVAPLKEARSTVRQLKTEFSPQSITGRLTDVKKDGISNIIEGSKVYNNISSKGMPVENVRKIMHSLASSGDKGAEAVASLQQTTILDLIDSGFSTKSRKIDGVQIFNPISFKNRINQLGQDKLNAIFAGNPSALKRIKNIDSIAKSLVPPEGAVPKGSASVIMDLMDKLGFIAISSKLPGGGALIEGVTRLSAGSKTRQEVGEAVAGKIDIQQLSNVVDETFPGIASALGIATVIEEQ